MNNIKALRKKYNLTQEEFAQILGVNRSMISEYENEVTDLSTENLIKLAIHFNTSTDYILGLTDNMMPHVLVNRIKNNRLKDIRKSHKLNQEYVAKKLYLVQESYSRYETGSHDIPNIVLIKLSNLYNTNVDYILCRTDDSSPY